MTHKHQPKRGRVPPFIISLETNDLIIHNCMVDYGATHNIMSLSVMRTVGLDCTRHYKAGDCNFSIDSRSVLAYGEIKYCCVELSSSPQNHIVFPIIVVDLPPTYSLVLGHERSYLLSAYPMNDGSCIILPNKDGSLIRVLHETKNHVCF